MAAHADIAVADAELLTPQEAFGLLRIGKTRGFELIASGQLGSVRIGKSRRIPRAALAQFIKSLDDKAN